MQDATKRQLLTEAKRIRSLITDFPHYVYEDNRSQYAVLYNQLLVIDPEAKSYLHQPPPQVLFALEGTRAELARDFDVFIYYLSKTVKPDQPKKEAALRRNVFDFSKMHPRIREQCESLFNTGHYADAILATYVSIEEEVRSKSGLDKIGKSLMSEVFTPTKPIISINEMKNSIDRDEQEGFMFIFMGVMQGIRNPKAHGRIGQRDPVSTLECLAFASLLLRRLDDSRLA